jgi:hypothetical protein
LYELRLEVPIVRCLPRFVPSESYASSFGFQWNRFDKLQVDAVLHSDLMLDRFYATTGWPTRVEHQVILDAGCGGAASRRSHSKREQTSFRLI